MSSRDTPWPVGTPCWLDLMVPDVLAAREFYRVVTNWTFVDTGPEFGHFQVCRVGDRNAAGIGATMTPAGPAGWTVYFATSDVEATASVVLAHGGQLILEPTEVGDVCRVALATDCFGARFGVFEAGSSVGSEVADEPGALVRQSGSFHDVALARRFYGPVFGHGCAEIPACAPEGAPFGWTAVIAVLDVDGAVELAAERGAAVLRPPRDTRFGRMSTLADPFGAVFAVHGANSCPEFSAERPNCRWSLLCFQPTEIPLKPEER